MPYKKDVVVFQLAVASSKSSKGREITVFVNHRPIGEMLNGVPQFLRFHNEYSLGASRKLVVSPVTCCSDWAMSCAIRFELNIRPREEAKPINRERVITTRRRATLKQYLGE